MIDVIRQYAQAWADLEDMRLDLSDSGWQREALSYCGSWFGLGYRNRVCGYVFHVGCYGAPDAFITFIDVYDNAKTVRLAGLQTPDYTAAIDRILCGTRGRLEEEFLAFAKENANDC